MWSGRSISFYFGPELNFVRFSIFKVTNEYFLRWFASTENFMLTTDSWEAMSIVSISVEAICYEGLEELESLRGFVCGCPRLSL